MNDLRILQPLIAKVGALIDERAPLDELAEKPSQARAEPAMPQVTQRQRGCFRLGP